MSLKSKIQALITAANAKTGETDATLTEAVQTLVDGYGGITPTGNIDITDTNVTDVTNYATAQVVDADLVAENIKKDVNILGVVGSFEGGGTEITDGIVVKARNADGYATEVDYYGDTVYPWTFGAGNNNNADTNNFVLRHIQTVNLKNTVTKLKDFAFAGATELTTVNGMDWDAITETGVTPIKFTYNWHFSVVLTHNIPISFMYCGITNIEANEWTQVPNNSFYGCTALKSAKFAKASTLGSYSANCFYGCTALETAEFGSVGHAVTSARPDIFNRCTQNFLTVTAYCKGNYVDTLLANIRNGATNATIIVKASEDTTYGGETYLAGETIITSTPT